MNKFRLLISSVFLLSFVLAGYSIIVTSPTYQEYSHLSSGFLSSETHRYHYFNVNPPLSQFIVSLPASQLGANMFSVPEKMFDSRIEQDIALEFIRANNKTHIFFLFMGRFLNYLFCLSIFTVSVMRFYGNKQTHVVLFICLLYITQPFFLAYSTIISPDMLGAVMGFAFFFYF